MPLAKTATTTTEPVVAPKTPLPDSPNFSEKIVHPELYRYFNVHSDTSEKSQLQEINDWARNGAKDVGAVLRQVSNLESKLGQPNVGETRISRMHNWVRVNNMMLSTRMEMKEEIAILLNKAPYAIDTTGS